MSYQINVFLSENFPLSINLICNKKLVFFLIVSLITQHSESRIKFAFMQIISLKELST